MTKKPQHLVPPPEPPQQLVDRWASYPRFSPGLGGDGALPDWGDEVRERGGKAEITPESTGSPVYPAGASAGRGRALVSPPPLHLLLPLLRRLRTNLS